MTYYTGIRTSPFQAQLGRSPAKRVLHPNDSQSAGLSRVSARKAQRSVAPPPSCGITQPFVAEIRAAHASDAVRCVRNLCHHLPNAGGFHRCSEQSVCCFRHRQLDS